MVQGWRGGSTGESGGTLFDSAAGYQARGAEGHEDGSESHGDASSFFSRANE